MALPLILGAMGSTLGRSLVSGLSSSISSYAGGTKRRRRRRSRTLTKAQMTDAQWIASNIGKTAAANYILRAGR